jgi:hypothetical protein
MRKIAARFLWRERAEAGKVLFVQWALEIAIAASALASLAAPALGARVGGGAGAARDCLVVLEAPANVPPSAPRHVRCVDGDPSCDGDHTANGVCAIAIGVCANGTFDPTCTLNGVQSMTVDHALDNGDPRFDPDFQALQDRIDDQLELPTAEPDLCTTATTFRVPIEGPLGAGRCSAERKKLVITSRSQVIDGRVFEDRDRLRLTCVPDPAACDAGALFTSTFDRIQRQIFDRSCALGGCHDSESRTGDLLLEAGAAYANLVGALPDNDAARTAGWLRVEAGATELSFLLRKVEGDLPAPSFGSRMPFGERKLPSTLRDVIRLWIEAGAPEAGWVPGTD